MLHVTCDLCGKDLQPGSDRRFVVKIEVFATHDENALSDEDFDQDPMEALDELLTTQEAIGELENEPTAKNFRFDLCPRCQKRYARDPLNRDALHVNFSAN